MNNEYMCIYLPDQLTRHPAGAASTKKISRFYIPDIFQTLSWMCCLLRMWRLWPSFTRVGGGLPATSVNVTGRPATVTSSDNRIVCPD